MLPFCVGILMIVNTASFGGSSASCSPLSTLLLCEIHGLHKVLRAMFVLIVTGDQHKEIMD